MEEMLVQDIAARCIASVPFRVVTFMEETQTWITLYSVAEDGPNLPFDVAVEEVLSIDIDKDTNTLVLLVG